MKHALILLLIQLNLISQSAENVIKSFEFTYSYQLDSLNNISFSGTANLPDSTIFTLTVLNFTSDRGFFYIDNHKFQVFDNEFKIESLEIGNRYSNNYKLTFQMAFPDSQPKSVVDVIGVKGKNLRGEVHETVTTCGYQSGYYYSLTDTVKIKNLKYFKHHFWDSEYFFEGKLGTQTLTFLANNKCSIVFRSYYDASITAYCTWTMNTDTLSIYNKTVYTEPEILFNDNSIQDSLFITVIEKDVNHGLPVNIIAYYQNNVDSLMTDYEGYLKIYKPNLDSIIVSFYGYIKGFAIENFKGNLITIKLMESVGFDIDRSFKISHDKLIELNGDGVFKRVQK